MHADTSVMRRIAVVGDSLDTGGEILSYSGPVFSIGDKGRQVALFGGAAWCETCRIQGWIAKAGGPRRIDFMGETAADEDIVICNCETPPRINAKLAGDSWCDDKAETMSASASARAVGGSVASDVTGAYDEQVHATAQGAIEGYPYFIETTDGRIFSGRVNDDGKLPRIHADTAADYSVYWGDEALAKQEGIR